MGEDIAIHEDVAAFFNRYLSTRPGELPLMLGRILREWYCTGLKTWISNPQAIPIYSKDKGDKINLKESGRIPYQKIPESRKQKIHINGDIGKTYKKFCNGLNVDPDDNATYQCRLFIKTYQLLKFEKLNKLRGMDKLQPK